jgi:putative transposase
MKALAIGGIEDHVHILLSLPATISISKAIQLIKGNSSKWISDTFEQVRNFSWQEGYGAFSVNISIIEETINYIKNQTTHHQHKSFKDEFIKILNKHGIAYDERYVWD